MKRPLYIWNRPLRARGGNPKKGYAKLHTLTPSPRARGEPDSKSKDLFTFGIALSARAGGTRCTGKKPGPATSPLRARGPQVVASLSAPREEPITSRYPAPRPSRPLSSSPMATTMAAGHHPKINGPRCARTVDRRKMTSTAYKTPANALCKSPVLGGYWHRR